MHLLVIAIFGKYCIHYIFCADIARLLQYLNKISDSFRIFLAILQYFQRIFLQYCLNISVLCGFIFIISVRHIGSVILNF